MYIFFICVNKKGITSRSKPLKYCYLLVFVCLSEEEIFYKRMTLHIDRFIFSTICMIIDYFYLIRYYCISSSFWITVYFSSSYRWGHIKIVLHKMSSKRNCDISADENKAKTKPRDGTAIIKTRKINKLHFLLWSP